ncbi:hypothetical protein GS8_1606 [Geobacillus stearothermophilus]|uniref:Uncharacterized protein n=1 Tax=Geobacillus stearothermophilus TaxID=1422 RepID=A0ABQ7HFD2_GEOSE|nr:hypothetical protein GS8_1606 [Geobacillus stearothermophilus]
MEAIPSLFPPFLLRYVGREKTVKQNKKESLTLNRTRR